MLMAADTAGETLDTWDAAVHVLGGYRLMVLTR
jgi:hypothetical protein